MPVTKTAKRAERGSLRRRKVNTAIISQLEIAIREAKRSKSSESIKKALSLADRAHKKNVIHLNKAARIKSRLAKIAPLTSKKTVKKTKTSTKKSK
jgi:small subunit ribosomal protein S20